MEGFFHGRVKKRLGSCPDKVVIGKDKECFKSRLGKDKARIRGGPSPNKVKIRLARDRISEN